MTSLLKLYDEVEEEKKRFYSNQKNNNEKQALKSVIENKQLGGTALKIQNTRKRLMELNHQLSIINPASFNNYDNRESKSPTSSSPPFLNVTNKSNSSSNLLVTGGDGRSSPPSSSPNDQKKRSGRSPSPSSSSSFNSGNSNKSKSIQGLRKQKHQKHSKGKSTFFPERHSKNMKVRGKFLMLEKILSTQRRRHIVEDRERYYFILDISP